MPILSQLRKNENAALGVGGVTYYNTLDSLPITGLTSGDQAFVSATERYYVSDGNGWFNTTLINKNIRWDSGGEPSAEAEITDSATPLIIIARAADSDQSVFLNQSFASDSAQYMATVTNDSSVFTFTPKTAAQIGASVAAGELSDSNGDFIYTFKWSDGLSFVNKAVTITYNPAGGGGGSGVPYGARAVIYNSASGSSSNHSNTIDYFTIATPGNSASFGNMLGTTVNGGSAHNVTVSNGSRIVYGAFYDNTDAGSPPVNGLEFVTASTLGNSTFMGTFTHRSGITGAGSGGKGYYAAGDGNVPGNDIEVVDIANGGNATDTGYDIGNNDNGAAHANSSRWIHAGGQLNGAQYTTHIEYFNVPVVANSTTFGSISSQGRTNPTGTGSDTRMLIAGGFYYSGSETLDNRVRNDIDYLTMATTGNTTDFGDLTVKRTSTGSTSNNVRAIFIGGFAGTSGRTNTMDYVTIDTTSNATDFGDMSGAGSYASTASGT